ncbi:cilia- and flagella-associated protein 337 [Aplochiton taeniatus]
MDALKDSWDPWQVYETEVPSSSSCAHDHGVSPEEELSLEHLLLLRDTFSRRTPPGKGSRLGQEAKAEPGSGERTQGHGGTRGDGERPGGARGRRGGDGERGMCLEEFREALGFVIGPDHRSGWVERFFSEVDVGCVGRVEWEELCSHLLQQCAERHLASVPRDAVLDAEARFQHCSHNKREPTVRVVAVPHPPPLRYVSVSKGGTLTVWNRRLHVLTSLGLSGDPAEEGANPRRFRGWTTDAVCMPNAHKVAVATSGRDIHFIDVSTPTCVESVHLFGFRNVPTALCFWHDTKSPGRRSLLLWGDEKGGVHLLWFLQPQKGLFENPFSNDSGPQKIYMQDIGEHSRLLTYQHLPDVHLEPINRIAFESHNDLVVTSSGSDASSLVVMNASRRRKPYVWNIERGVTCFDFSRTLNLLVTGGLDPAVRLWNRFVTARPVATLLGHGTTVLDVVIYQPVGQIFSYSRDAELRLWDISSHLCLRTIHLQFPCLQPGRAPEHGNFPFLLMQAPPLPATTPPHLLVGCKDYLALLRLAEGKKDGGEGWRDDGGWGRGSGERAPLSCLLCNPALGQAITGGEDSSVTIWDLETGALHLRVSHAHGEEDVTCMALDSSHRRLITGARNGTVKVWSLLNGQILHKLEPVTGSEVTGIVCLRDNQLLVAGWSQRIAQYDIAGAKDVYVKADMSWKSRQVHNSDIVAFASCPTLKVVATASHAGEVIVWTLETQRPLVRLRTQAPQTGSAPPVDGLLFLQRRAEGRQWRNTPLLVSSQSGCLYFWSLAGHTHTHGQFYRPGHSGESVIGLASDQQNNNILVTGDTAGWLSVWDISHYALDVAEEPHLQCPPLRCSWRAHRGAVVSVEVLQRPDTLLVLSASADGSAGLWTAEGQHVGHFGQEPGWDAQDPDTYQGGAVDVVTSFVQNTHQT